MHFHQAFRMMVFAITTLSDSGYVISWWSDYSGNREIYAQRYDASGNKVNAEFQVNTVSGGDQTRTVSIAALPDEGFAVAWNSNTSGENRIYTQRYSRPSVSNWTSSSNINTSLDELAAAKERLRSLQEKLSTNMNIITTRSSFTDSMVNILNTGADNLTNADMNEEGANALMLQTKQSLGMTSLSLGAQAAQSVLRLFN